MSKKELIIVGTSANAKQLYDFNKIHNLFDVVGFAVNGQYITQSTYLNLPVYPLEKLDTYIDKDKTKLFVALGWNRLNADRKHLYELLKNEGYKFANVISPNAIIRGNIVGDNCWINDYVVLQSDSIIHSDVIIRELCVVGNNTEIGSHCFLGVKSMVAGGCNIGQQCFVGINATIFDSTTIGKKCIIGGGAIVKRNVSDNTVCKTNINDTIVKTYDANVIESKLMFKKNVR